MSSRGQVVIPQNLRERLGIREGEKFVVIGENNTIVLKKIDMPSFKGFEKLVNRTRDFAKSRGLKEADVKESIRKARKK